MDIPKEPKNLKRYFYQLFSKTFISFCSILLLHPIHAFAATWYVDCAASSTSADGTLLHPWPNTSQIVWSGKISAGDTVLLRGKTDGGCSYSGLSTGSNGTPTAPITIARSSESGMDGEVRLAPPVRINNSNIILDGKDRYLFKIDCASSQIGIDVTSAGDRFEMRNTSIVGYQNGADFGSVRSYAPNLTIRSSNFVSTCSQDVLWYFPGSVARNSDGSGTASLTIENSIFRDNFSKDIIHRDLVNIDGGGGFNMYLRGNIIMNMGDAFLLQNSSKLGNVEFAYNVVSNVARAVAAGSGNQGANSSIAYNNIFYAMSSAYEIGDSVATVSIPGTTFKNNLYGSGTTYIKDGSSANLSGLNFVDSTSYTHGKPTTSEPKTRPLGLDLIGLNANDGFAIQTGSTAKNAGSVFRDHSRDILGNPLDGLPDLGPYELQSGGGGAIIPNPPNNLRIAQ